MEQEIVLYNKEDESIASVTNNSLLTIELQDFNELVGQKDLEQIEESESQMIGKIVGSLEEAFKMYNDYAYLHGFGVRKGSSHKSAVDKHITSKTYNCCKEGKRRNEKEDKIGETSKRHKKNETRVGCKAQLVVKPHGNDGRWVVVKHIMTHNHVFLRPEETHLLASHRYVPEEHIQMLNGMIQSGIRMIDAYNYTRIRMEGSPELGYTAKDAYNELAARKRKDHSGGDAQELIYMFDQIQKFDDEFYFDYKLDDNNHLESFFWRDKRMKDDYLLFGDLLVFDTTFKTNKYRLSCAPFVSMNHHRRNILVGCGFVKSETITSFTWLFETFKKSMDGVQPQTIITDQDAAMDNAIRVCFPSTCHRLCVWHIGQNAKKHLASYYMKTGFGDLFGYVLTRCETEQEFSTAWECLENTYGVGENHWFKELYGKRAKWSNVFNKIKFTSGAISSQRSESLNSCIKARKKATMELMDCYNMFCEIIKQWRRKERDDNVNNKNGYPTVANKYNSLLQEAKKIYTIRAYKIFEEEYLKIEECKQILRGSVENEGGGKIYTYHVFQKRHVKLPETLFTVHYRELDNAVACECARIVYVGQLCCHALRVMNVHHVTSMPRDYYVKRWTRNANPDPKKNEDQVNENGKRVHPKDWKAWNSRLVSWFKKLVDEAENNPRARKICEDGFNHTRHKLEIECGNVDMEENENGSESNFENATVMDPVSIRKKGEQSGRFKSCLEKPKRRRKCMATSKKTDTNPRNPTQKENQNEDLNNSNVEGQQPEEVYIPQFGTQFSQFEGQPSTSGTRPEEDNSNIRDVEFLLLGPRPRGSNLTSNEAFEDLMF